MTQSPDARIAWIARRASLTAAGLALAGAALLAAATPASALQAIGGECDVRVERIVVNGVAQNSYSCAPGTGVIAPPPPPRPQPRPEPPPATGGGCIDPQAIVCGGPGNTGPDGIDYFVYDRHTGGGWITVYPMGGGGTVTVGPITTVHTGTVEVGDLEQVETEAE